MFRVHTGRSFGLNVQRGTGQRWRYHCVCVSLKGNFLNYLTLCVYNENFHVQLLVLQFITKDYAVT